MYASDVLYFYTFSLGMLTAFAEIIGKFSDEPLKSLNTPQAVFYHVSNGAVAAFALKILYLYDVAHQTPLDRMKIVLAAGLGSMLIMRSKLFNLKVRAKDGTQGGEDISFGPDQIVKVFFRFMERAIDRVRAQSRIEFVKNTMDNVDFDAVSNYTLTMLKSAQTLSADEVQNVENEIKAMSMLTQEDEQARKELANLESSLPNLSEDQARDALYRIQKLKDQISHASQLKSYKLGFLLLNNMGEDFVSTTFESLSVDYQLRGQLISKAAASKPGLLASLPFVSSDQKTLNYLAYGSSMATRIVTQKLNWPESDITKFIEAAAPQKALIKNYKIEFNKAANRNPREGYANLEPEDSATAEGVVYRLPMSAIEFLDKAQLGYRRDVVTVEIDGESVKAQTYVATETRLGLKPSLGYLSIVVEGAREHRLSPSYIDALRKTPTLLSAAAATAA